MEISDDNVHVQTQQFVKRAKPIDSASTLFVINSTIQQLFSLALQQIKQKQLLVYAPNFTHNDIMNIFNQHISQYTPNYGTTKSSGMYQDDVNQIKKIQKDNLSPKQLPSQHPQKDQEVKELPDNISSVGSRKLSMTNRSSFLKRKTNNESQQKIKKSISTKKDPFQKFTSLLTLEHQDPQIIYLREKVHFNAREKEKQQQIQCQRAKNQQERIQSFKSQFSDKQNFTFGFDGQALGSRVMQNQKLNYYAMRFGVKTLGKKFRTAHKQSMQNGKQQGKNYQTIKSKMNKPRQSAFDSLNVSSASIQIPTFQKQHKTFIPQTDPSKLKIIEYKKLYGRKFSRYDNYSITLDVSSVLGKKSTEEDYFPSKKHLTDSISVNKSRSSSLNKQSYSRKLALPKLQGKYKVLDRYQQI